MYLVDTVVVAELARTPVAPTVLAYFKTLRRDVVFTSTVCVAEISFGLEQLSGRRRTQLAARTDALLANVFAGHILPFDEQCAALYGPLVAHREAIGRPISAEDGMIASTARAHGATLLTRNAHDFADCGIKVVNPWTDPPPPQAPPPRART